MASPENGWIKVAASIDEIVFASNKIAEITAAGTYICIAKWHEAYFAFAQKCPHASGRLAEGFIDALGNVVCPLHQYKFCLKNGRNISGEGYYLKQWPVQVTDKGVFVQFEKLFFL